jgi:hypothetical protein
MGYKSANRKKILCQICRTMKPTNQFKPYQLVRNMKACNSCYEKKMLEKITICVVCGKDLTKEQMRQNCHCCSRKCGFVIAKKKGFVFCW